MTGGTKDCRGNVDSLGEKGESLRRFLIGPSPSCLRSLVSCPTSEEEFADGSLVLVAKFGFQEVSELFEVGYRARGKGGEPHLALFVRGGGKGLTFESFRGGVEQWLRVEASWVKITGEPLGLGCPFGRRVEPPHVY
ncbi:hypothetical protein ACLOJK_008747 [Asimina triloba]